MFGGVFNRMNQRIVNRQQHGFNKNLAGGVKGGAINRQEFMRLSTFDQKTRELEGKFLKDGKLTFKERQILEKRNSFNQKMLNRYKHGDFHPGSRKPRNSIERKMQNQLHRTYSGLRSGSLTQGEGVRTLDRQGQVATNYGRMKATPNGFWNRVHGKSTFSPWEKRSIHRQLNRNSSNISHLKNNWASDWGAPGQIRHHRPRHHYQNHYHPPMQFPSYPSPQMGPGMGQMPGFPGGGCPPYMSPFTQQMFAMQMMQMQMMMQMMGFGMPMEMIGGMPGGMNNFMNMRPHPLRMSPPMGQMMPMGPLPFNAQTGNRLADTAMRWNGAAFKPGQTKRCADFVSTMIEQSGQAPPGFKHEVSASRLRNYGKPVPGGTQNLKPGDVVFFGNTYRPGNTTHVGIYVGNGKFAHRPTANKPVKIDNINSKYYSSHFTGANRLGV